MNNACLVAADQGHSDLALRALDIDVEEKEVELCTVVIESGAPVPHSWLHMLEALKISAMVLVFAARVDGIRTIDQRSVFLNTWHFAVGCGRWLMSFARE